MPGRRAVAGSVAALGVLVATAAAPFFFGRSALPAFAGVATLAVALSLGLLTGRLLWRSPTWTGAAAPIVLAGVFAAIAGVVGFLLAFIAQISWNLCSADQGTAPSIAGILGATTYLGVGVWGFQRPRRLLWGWPAAVLLGFGMSVLVAALVTQGAGYCET